MIGADAAVVDDGIRLYLDKPNFGVSAGCDPDGDLWGEHDDRCLLCGVPISEHVSADFRGGGLQFGLHTTFWAEAGGGGAAGGDVFRAERIFYADGGAGDREHLRDDRDGVPDDGGGAGVPAEV